MIKETKTLIFILLFFPLLIISIFVTGYLQSFTPFAIDYMFLSFSILWFKIVLTPSAIINGFTISAVFFAIIQLYYTRKEIDRITETEALGTTEEVVRALLNVLSAEEIYKLFFVAAIPAVGGTGASDKLFNQFKHIFEQVIENIEENAKLKYFNPKNKKLIKNFYNNKGLTDVKKINKLIALTNEMHAVFINSGTQYYAVNRIGNINPHFLIISTKNGLKGVIWNIDEISKEGKVESAGFLTRNEEVINTFLRFYEE